MSRTLPLLAALALIGCSSKPAHGPPAPAGAGDKLGKSEVAGVFAEYLCAQKLPWDAPPDESTLLRAVLTHRQLSADAWATSRAEVEAKAAVRAEVDALVPAALEKICPGGVLPTTTADTLRNLVAAGPVVAADPAAAGGAPLPSLGAAAPQKDEAAARPTAEAPPDAAPTGGP